MNRRTAWGLAFLGALAWSVTRLGFENALINPGGWPLVLQFFQAGLRPDLSPAFLALVGEAALITLAFAVCGSALSVLLGVVGGVLASEIWWQAVLGLDADAGCPSWACKAPWVTARALLAGPRAIHELIWGLFFVNILGLVPLTAILAIALPFGAITAKVFSEILDETPRGPMLALVNSGVSPLKALFYGLIPQAFPNLLSYIFYRFECSIRAAAVLGLIGAGGLGYQVFLSLQSLRYEQMWTLFFALFLLSGLTDLWSGELRRRLGHGGRFDMTPRKRLPRRSPIQGRDPVLNFSAIGVLGLLLFSFGYLRPDFQQLFTPRTANLLWGVMRASWPLDLDGAQVVALLNLSAQTLAMSILAIVLAGVGGVLLSFPAARAALWGNGAAGARPERLWWREGVSLLARGALLVARAIPAPIWALVFLFVLFPGILPGALALGVYTLGVLGRLMAEVVENLDPRPLHALKTQGARESQVFLYGVLPSALPPFLAYSLYRWEVCLRATVIVGLVGAGGLGRLLTEQLSSFDYPGVVVTLVVFMLLTFGVDLVSASARRALK